MKNIVFLLCLLSAIPLKASVYHSVDNLTCEYESSPIAVETSAPRFSWQTNSSRRAFKQTAYRLLVSDSEQLLEENKGNFWDTKIVKSDQSLLVEYAGKPLKPNTRYYWKVKVYDEHKKSSPWSAIQQFTTSFDPADPWTEAHWIALEKQPESERVVPGIHAPDVARLLGEKHTARNLLPQFRKEFTINKRLRSALVSVCGVGHFDLFLDGVKVGDHYLDPAWTDYDQELNYVTFDVTSSLQEGRHTFGVMLGNGFYNIPRQRYYKLIQSYGYPKMILRMILKYEDGTSEELTSDASWKVTSSPLTFSSIYSGEDYDARKEQKGWMQNGFDDAHWENALIVDDEKKVPLRTQYTTPVKEMSEIPVFKYWKTHRDTWVYDLGQNFSGIVSIQTTGKEGQVINMHLSELAEETNHAGAEGVVRTDYNLVYTLNGKGLEEWKPRFTYFGFRYIEVEGAVPEKADNPLGLPVIHSIKGIHTRNSVPQRGRFHCSNPLFNRTFELIDWGIRSNFASYPTDCPHREKLEWIEQIHLMFGSLQYNYGIERMFTKCMRDMSLSQTPEGLVPDITPTYTIFEGGFYDSPEWGSAFILMPWQFYETYGDTRLLSTYYESMKRYVDYLGTKSTGHIVSHGLGDWYDLGPNPPGHSQLTSFGVTATAVYYYDIQALERIARLLGKTEDADRFHQLAAEVKKAFNATFLNKEKGYYDRNSQTANAIALYGDLAEEEYRDKIMENLLQDIRSRGNALTAGDVGYNYLLRVLERSGASDVIYAMNSRYDVPGYGYQLAQGATSLPESWNALRSSSHNHFMLGHLMQWFYEYVGGIRRKEGTIAYKEIVIAPEPVGDLTSAEVSYQSPYGLIRSEWKKQKDLFELYVEVPANTTATVLLPIPADATVYEGGLPLSQHKEIKDKGVVGKKRMIEIGSGIYKFKADINHN